MCVYIYIYVYIYMYIYMCVYLNKYIDVRIQKYSVPEVGVGVGVGVRVGVGRLGVEVLVGGVVAGGVVVVEVGAGVVRVVRGISKPLCCGWLLNCWWRKA
jgi:hypothetical protein